MCATCVTAQMVQLPAGGETVDAPGPWWGPPATAAALHSTIPVQLTATWLATCPADVAPPVLAGVLDALAAALRQLADPPPPEVISHVPAALARWCSVEGDAAGACAALTAIFRGAQHSLHTAALRGAAHALTAVLRLIEPSGRSSQWRAALQAAQPHAATLDARCGPLDLVPLLDQALGDRRGETDVAAAADQEPPAKRTRHEQVPVTQTQYVVIPRQTPDPAHQRVLTSRQQEVVIYMYSLLCRHIIHCAQVAEEKRRGAVAQGVVTYSRLDSSQSQPAPPAALPDEGVVQGRVLVAAVHAPCQVGLEVGCTQEILSRAASVHSRGSGGRACAEALRSLRQQCAFTSMTVRSVMCCLHVPSCML